MLSKTLLFSKCLVESFVKPLNQQKKQCQKEFKERKEHQESLKVAAKKAKRYSSGKDDEIDKMSKIED